MAPIPTMADVQADLLARTPTSAALHKSGLEVLADAPATATLLVPYPIYIREAKGSHVTDVDGNQYVDLTMGMGPHVLGHAPDVVVDAVKAAAERGLQYALHNPYQEPLARLIVEAAPCAEKVFFCNSGTEATMHAIRAGRAFTGKTKIALFNGSYHGAHDYVLVDQSGGSPDAPGLAPRLGGIPQETVSTVMMLPYWNEAAFDLIRKHRDELALVMVEPVQGGKPHMNHVEWLRELREVCRESGVLLMFDEVITGFRLAFGGAQERFGIVPDYATYGKAAGGGMPIGVVAGRADLMDVLRHPWSEAPGPKAFAAGTFSGNPMSMAAGEAAVSHLGDHREVYVDLAEQCNRLATEANRFFESEGYPAEIQHADSIMILKISPEAATGAPQGRPNDVLLRTVYGAFYLQLLSRGVIAPGAHSFLPSSAHTTEDIDHVIHAFKESIRGVRAQGLC